MTVKANSEIAMRFLIALRAEGPWTVTAIVPDGKGAPTRTFYGAREHEKMRRWLEMQNSGGAGVYFCANPVRWRRWKRPCESDIGRFEYVGLDFDPLKGESVKGCQARVRSHLKGFPKLKPTFLWQSGNGMQALWRVRPAIQLNTASGPPLAKSKAMGLIETMGGRENSIDSTQSLEHLFRIPGMVNFPNRAKRLAGRVACRAGDFEYDPDCAYDPIEDLPDYKGKRRPAIVRGEEVMEIPPGGWDTPGGINDAVLCLTTTEDLAGEGRSMTAIRTARRMRDYGISETLAFELMWERWVPRCQYPWEHEELRAKVTRAYQNAQNDAGCKTIAYAMLSFPDDLAD